MGAGDLARPRHGERAVPELSHPAGGGELRRTCRISSTAVNEAVALGANVVSNSYGGERVVDRSARRRPLTTTRVSRSSPAPATTASESAIPRRRPTWSRWAARVCSKSTNTGTRNATETAWSGAGSGCSQYEAKPAWQTDTGCSHRTVSDVSAVADPTTGVWVYDSADPAVGTCSAERALPRPIDRCDLRARRQRTRRPRARRRTRTRHRAAAQRRRVGQQRQLRPRVPLHRRRSATTVRPVSGRRTPRPRSQRTAGHLPHRHPTSRSRRRRRAGR